MKKELVNPNNTRLFELTIYKFTDEMLELLNAVKQIQKEFWKKFYDEIKISEKIKNIFDIILFSLYGNTRIILKQ